MKTETIFHQAKEDLFACCKFMQEHEDKIIEQLKADTNATTLLRKYADELESILESMVNYPA